MSDSRKTYTVIAFLIVLFICLLSFLVGVTLAIDHKLNDIIEINKEQDYIIELLARNVIKEHG